MTRRIGKLRPRCMVGLGRWARSSSQRGSPSRCRGPISPDAMMAARPARLRPNRDAQALVPPQTEQVKDALLRDRQSLNASRPNWSIVALPERRPVNLLDLHT